MSSDDRCIQAHFSKHRVRTYTHSAYELEGTTSGRGWMGLGSLRNTL